MYMYVYLKVKDLDKVIQKKFVKSDGPLVKRLDDVLASFHVQRQAYYGGTFVGNHVHSCLKVYIPFVVMFATFRFVYSVGKPH